MQERVFISLSEFAELENSKLNTLVQKIKRFPNDYITEKRPNPNGGKPLVYVAVSSLSPQAQRRYKAKETVTATKDKPSKKTQWYLDVDLNWYKSNFPEYYGEAVSIAEDIEKYDNKDYNMTSGQFESFMSEKYSKDRRQIRRYTKNYYEAAEWAKSKQLETGTSYDYLKVLSVGRKPRVINEFPSLTGEVRAFIENTLYDELFAINRNPISNLYDDLENKATTEGWKLPSYDTVLRYVTFIKSQDGNSPLYLVSNGIRQWKNVYSVKSPRDLFTLKPLEVIQTDGHTFDCFVRVQRADGSWEAIRPVLVTFLDMKSRVSVCHAICEHADAQIVKKCLISMIYPKKNEALPHGVPKILMTDCGKEITAQTLTGVPRNHKIDFDEDTEGFFSSIGIEHVTKNLPYQPWAKGELERFHGTISTKFTKRQPGYVGSLTGKYTAAKIQKNIKAMLEREELPTIEEFAQQYEDWLVNSYHKRKHRGLKEQGEKSPTPIEVFNNSDKYYKPAPPKAHAISLLMKALPRVVRSMGIELTVGGQKLYYNNPCLERGSNVLIRYLPDDMTKILVYTERDKPLCEAVSQTVLHMAAKYSESSQISEAALTEHYKEQKRQLRQARDTISKRRTPYEERQLNLENAGKKVIVPESLDEAETVVAFPNGSRFVQEGRLQKLNAKPERTMQDTNSDICRKDTESEDARIDRMFKYLEAL